jgi:hypothetical protein
MQDYNFAYFLDGCGTWSLALGKEHRAREFENWMLRRVFGPMKDNVTGGWRKLPSKVIVGIVLQPSMH